MRWPFSKKEDQSKDENKWQEKPPKRSRFAYFRELPAYMKVFVIIGIIFALNTVLFFPLGLTAILFEVWISFIQALRMQMPLWIALAFMALAALLGIYFMPRIEIPDTEEKYIYFKHESDGNLQYFTTLHGKLAFKDDYVRRVGFFRFTVIGEVSSVSENEREGVITYESDALEVTQDLALLAENRHLKRTIAQMERDQRNTSLSKLLDELGVFVERTKERR